MSRLARFKAFCFTLLQEVLDEAQALGQILNLLILKTFLTIFWAGFTVALAIIPVALIYLIFKIPSGPNFIERAGELLVTGVTVGAATIPFAVCALLSTAGGLYSVGACSVSILTGLSAGWVIPSLRPQVLLDKLDAHFVNNQHFMFEDAWRGLLNIFNDSPFKFALSWPLDLSTDLNTIRFSSKRQAKARAAQEAHRKAEHRAEADAEARARKEHEQSQKEQDAHRKAEAKARCDREARARQDPDPRRQQETKDRARREQEPHKQHGRVPRPHPTAAHATQLARQLPLVALALFLKVRQELVETDRAPDKMQMDAFYLALAQIHKQDLPKQHQKLSHTDKFPLQLIRDEDFAELQKNVYSLLHEKKQNNIFLSQKNLFGYPQMDAKFILELKDLVAEDWQRLDKQLHHVTQEPSLCAQEGRDCLAKAWRAVCNCLKDKPSQKRTESRTARKGP